MDSFEPQAHLPLKPAWLHILLSLANGPKHGYAIRTLTEERTNGRVRLWPATLYGSIRDLVDAGLLLEDADPPEDEDRADTPTDDPRRRYYRMTDEGREVLRGEADRLASIVSAARSSQALSEGT